MGMTGIEPALPKELEPKSNFGVFHSDWMYVDFALEVLAFTVVKLYGNIKSIVTVLGLNCQCCPQSAPNLDRCVSLNIMIGYWSSAHHPRYAPPVGR